MVLVRWTRGTNSRRFQIRKGDLVEKKTDVNRHSRGLISAGFCIYREITFQKIFQR